MADGSNYFSHDYNARQDIKIKSLIRKHGMVAYGIFWAIVEDLYQNANALPLDCESIAYELRCDIEVCKDVILGFNLFTVSDNVFSSVSVQKRIDKRNEKSVKASKSAEIRWGNANAMQPHSERNAIKESKVKESKEKETINKQYRLADFDKFWDMYGKHTDKKKCSEKFMKLAESEVAAIKETLYSYIRSTPDVKYRKNPLTYLNGKCWQDITPQEQKQADNVSYSNGHPIDVTNPNSFI